jgi:hypothetical protein
MSNIYRFKAFEILPDDFLKKLSSKYIIKNVKFTFKNKIENPKNIKLHICGDPCVYDVIYLYYNSLQQYNNTYIFNAFPIVQNIIYYNDFPCFMVYDFKSETECELEFEFIYHEKIYLTNNNIYDNIYDIKFNINTSYVASNCFNSFNDLLNYLSFYLNTSIEEIEIWINEQININKKSCLAFHKMIDKDGKILLEKLNDKII